MGLEDDLKTDVAKVFGEQWTTRSGQVVPKPEDVQLRNDAVQLEGTVLYADLAESTAMVKSYKPMFAAEIYKTYLHCAAKIIKSLGGTITAYDGDRIMAVFLGDGKNSAAAKCGLRINWAVGHVIEPALKAQYPSTDFQLRQKIGIDTSELFVARTGVRGSNDLVWVGTAANYAAKLAALAATYPTYITSTVHDMLNEESKFGPTGQSMWTRINDPIPGIAAYGSTWHWGP